MLYKRIKALRLQRGFSAREMAQRLQMNVAAYNRIEAGTMKIEAEELPLLVSALECTINDLFEAGALPVESGYILKETFFNDFNRLMRSILESQREAEEKNRNFMKEIIHLVTQQARPQDS